MTPIQTTPMFEQSTDAPQPPSPERATLFTRSETVECNCPDHCERDHEVD